MSKDRERRQYYLLRIRRKKEEKPCVDCGYFYPHYVMQYDHVRGNKVGTVGSLIHKVGWARILEEIKKCDLVCANCHCIRTHIKRLMKIWKGK